MQRIDRTSRRGPRTSGLRDLWNRRRAGSLGRRSLYRVALSALGFVAVCGPLAPAEIVVDGDCTLIDAIDAANGDVAIGSCAAGAGADDIRLTANVELTEVHNRIGGPTGLPAISSGIAIRGGGFAIRRVSGSPRFRIFRNSPRGSLILEDVRIANGSLGPDDGAGIRNDRGRVQLIGSVVTRNTVRAGLGAGISNDGGEVVLTNSRVTESESTATNGAAIFNLRGTVRLTNSSISRNTSGIRNDRSGAVLSLIDSVVVDNDAWSISNSGGTMRIVRSTVANNRDPFGVIENTSGFVNLRNSTVSGNARGLRNGGFYAYASTTIVNSTITGNGSYGINNYCYGFGGCKPGQESRVFITSSIVADNEGDDCRGIGDYFPSGVSFDGDGTCDDALDLTGLDPVLADHGGPTPIHALLEGSSAIDAAGACGLTFDQRGFPRDPERCDSGAFEFGALPVDPQLTVSGHCPGEVTLSLDGATPGGSVALVTGPGPGLTVVPGGPCEGTELGVEGAEHRGRLDVEDDGTGLFTRQVPSERCGTYLQALDLVTCAVGNVVALPRD